MAKAVSAIMKPVAFEGPLAAFMGKKEGPRFEVPKKIWAHIKSAKLQDPKHGRIVNVDATLAPLLGKKVG
ncbi:MAG: SWIB/MDM2 domain-containing protein, partial [Candidatus Thermoplasmatota archaeon]|nr:SWIB/MDM2 domain-containing protein [Candidatus Thermoplasmatota archaeon]